MSPIISMVPFMLPIKLAGLSTIGTSLATGRPRLVITTSFRCRCTSSSTERHFALNSPAAICVLMTMVIVTWSHASGGGPCGPTRRSL